MGSEAAHGSEGLGVLALLHEPTRGLGAEEDAAEEDEGRDKGRAELKTPGDATDVLDDDIGAEAQEDT